MRYLAAVLLLIMAPVLQGTILRNAAPGGVTVDICFVAAVAIGFVHGPLAGLGCGALGGALLGVAAGDLAAEYALLYATVGMLAGFVQIDGARHLPLAAVAAAVLTISLLLGEIALLRPIEMPTMHVAAAATLAAWHAALAVPVTASLWAARQPRWAR